MDKKILETIEQIQNPSIIKYAKRILPASRIGSPEHQAYVEGGKVRQSVVQACSKIKDISTSWDSHDRDLIAKHIAKELLKHVEEQPQFHLKKPGHMNRIAVMEDASCYSLCTMAHLLYRDEVMKTLDYHYDKIDQPYHHFVREKIDIVILDSLRAIEKNPELNFLQAFNHHRKFAIARIYEAVGRDYKIDTVSIDSQLGDGGNASTTLHNFLTRSDYVGFEEDNYIHPRDFEKAFEELAADEQLSQRDIAIFRERLDGRSYAKIGKDYELGRGRTRLICNKVEKKLTRYIRDNNPGHFNYQEGEDPLEQYKQSAISEKAGGFER